MILQQKSYLHSKHKSDFYCLNCLHFFRTENKLKPHEKLCKNKDFCVMPSEKDNMLELNKMSDKMPYIIYADIESLIEKIDGCANNPKNSSTTKIGEYIPCKYSMSTIPAFDSYFISWECFISWGRLYEKVLYFFKKTYYRFN